MWQPVFVLLETRLWIACAFCEIALCSVLAIRGLHRRYRYLFALALTNATRDIFLYLGFGTASLHYKFAWLATLPVLMFVQAAAVFEAYGNFVNQYRRIGAFASGMLTSCLTSLLLISCFCVKKEFRHEHSVVQIVALVYRYFAVVLAGCLVLPCLLLCRFPRPAKKGARNLKVHLWILCCYFCTYVFSFLFVNLLGARELTIEGINSTMLASLCVLYICWTVLLTRKGEEVVEWPEVHPEILELVESRNRAVLGWGRRLRRSLARNPEAVQDLSEASVRVFGPRA